MGSFLGVGNLLATWQYWWKEPEGCFLFLLCNKTLLFARTVYCYQKGKVLTSVLLIFIVSLMLVEG